MFLSSRTLTFQKVDNDFLFESIDNTPNDEDSYIYQIEDTSENPMKKEMLSAKIRDLMLKYLNEKEYHVIRLSYRLGCDKLSAKQIASKLEIKGSIPQFCTTSSRYLVPLESFLKLICLSAELGIYI